MIRLQFYQHQHSHIATVEAEDRTWILFLARDGGATLWRLNAMADEYVLAS